MRTTGWVGRPPEMRRVRPFPAFSAIRSVDWTLLRSMGGIFSKLHLKVPLPQLQPHAISFTWIPGDHEMKHWWIVAEDLITSHRRLRAPKSRGPRRVELSCDPLEERVTPSHLGLAHHVAAAVHVHEQVSHHSSGAKSTLPITAPQSTLPILLPGGSRGHTPLPVTAP